MTRKLPFNLAEFLTLLLKFTDFHTDTEEFLSCLNIWDDFVEFMQIQADSNLPSLPHEPEFAPAQYSGPLVELADHLVDRIMFSSNSKILGELDTESYVKHEESSGEETTSTELLDFQSRCFDLISGVAGLYPTESVSRLAPKLLASLGTISALQASLAARQGSYRVLQLGYFLVISFLP